MSEEISRLVSSAATVVPAIDVCVCIITLVSRDRCRPNDRQVLVVPASQSLIHSATRSRQYEPAGVSEKGRQPRQQWDLKDHAEYQRALPRPNGDVGTSRVIPIFGRVLVKHEANQSSGGHIAEIEIGAFISLGNGPEQQGLLRLIATVGFARTPKEAQGRRNRKGRRRSASFGSGHSNGSRTRRLAAVG